MKSAPKPDRPAVIVAANSSWNLVNFRGPIIRGLQNKGLSVIASAPEDDATSALRQMGVEFAPAPVDPSGRSPLNDVKLLLHYHSIIGRKRPAAFLSFTPKPNIYGSIAAAWNRVAAIPTITGLGTGFLSGQGLQALVSGLYRYAFRKADRVLFHNDEDRDLFLSKGLVRSSQAIVVAGSGVDLDHFRPRAGKRGDRPPTFLFIGRFLRDKGAMEFAEAAAIVKRQRDARFQMLGRAEDHPKAVAREVVEAWARAGTVELPGTTDDVRRFMADADCVVLPSYREGLPRVLLEASAMAKPVIATDVPGCRQAVEPGVTGLLCEPRSARSLAEAMMAIADRTPEERSEMGRAGRRKAEHEFSEDDVVATYLKLVEQVTG